MSNDNFLSGFNFDTSPFTQALQSSMELMNQTWQNLGTNKTMPFATPPMNVEELDKRIEELKHVENWLNMNLAMLKNTIQGLELQRHSIASFKDLMQTVSDQHKDTPSLDEVLSNFSKGTAAEESQAAPLKSTSASVESHLADTHEASGATLDEAIGNATAGAQAAAEALQQAGQAWWGLMQNQLEGLLSSQADQQTQIEQVTAAAGVEANAKAQKVTPTRLKRANKPAAKRVTKPSTSNHPSTTSSADTPSAASVGAQASSASASSLSAVSDTGAKRAATPSKTPAKKVAARKKAASSPATVTPASASTAKPRTSARKTSSNASKTSTTSTKKTSE